MRSTRIQALSFAILSLGLALVAGCDPPPPPKDCNTDGSCPAPACDVGDESDECIEPTVCDQEPCRYVFSCIAPAPAPTVEDPDPDPLRLCNGNTLAQQDGYRTMCEYDQQAADAFCLSECMAAGAQNGYTLQETMVLCQNSTAMPELWYVNDEQVVCKNTPPGNIPFNYKPEDLCPAADGADPNAPDPTVEPDEDLDHIFCHGTAQPTTRPASADPNYNFPDVTQLNYWLETWELDEWHATSGTVGYDTNCGFKVYRILYELSGLNDDEICQHSCSERVAALELDSQNPSDPEAARILHDNCDSFVAETMCKQAGPPPLVGPTTMPLTLAAALQQGSTYTTTSFSGTISYSTYDCAPGTPNCGIVINDVSLDMNSSVSGVWLSSSTSTSGIPFSSSDLSLAIPRPASGAYSLVTNAFSLDPYTVPLHVEGAITVGSPGGSGGSQSIDIDTTNTDAISGTIESDGSVTLYGTFDFGPGVALHFGTPGPM